MHITASVYTGDNKSGLHADTHRKRQRADARAPSNVDRSRRDVAITVGQLHLGPWQYVFPYQCI